MEQDRKPNPADFLLEERKEKILESSPLLAAFLGKVGTEAENHEQLSHKMEEYGEKFSQGLGETWFSSATNPMVALASLMKIFQPEASEFDSAEIRNISGQVIFIGHELAKDEDMIEAFSGAVAAKLRTSKLVTKEGHFGNVKTFVETGMRSGVMFAEDLKKKEVEAKTQQAQETPTPEDDEKLTVFRDFINTLDLSDFDKHA